MNQRKLLIYILHTLAWLIGIAQFFFHGEDITINHFRQADGNLLIPLIYGTVCNVILFYSHAYWMIPRFLGKNHFLQYLTWLICIFFTVTWIESMIDHYLIQQYYPHLDLPFWTEHFWVNAMFHLFFLVASYTYRFSLDWRRDKRLQRKLREEKLSAELSLLKAQIHPHFLFNTLNNLFGLARKQAAYETADGIARLSELMQYMIYEADSEKIALDKEVEYLKNYIGLQRLRLHEEDDVDIQFEYDIHDGKTLIAPMLLITFVENAFKHGISLQRKSYIDIFLKADDEVILFDVKNSLAKSETDKAGMGSGIGMKNVKKRLNILYPSTHELQIKSNEDVFEINLKILLR